MFDADIYNVYRRDRNFDASNKKRGGGVLLAISKKYDSCFFDIETVCDTFSDIYHIDVVAVRLKVGNDFIYVFNVYIPPSVTSDEYDILFDALESLYPIYGSNILIFGDFNIPEYYAYHINKVRSRNVNSLLNFMNYLNISQHNFISNSNNKILDLVLCNKPCNVVHSPELLVQEDNHHPALLCEINGLFNRKNEGFPLYNSTDVQPDLNFKKANFQALYQELTLTDWSCLSFIPDVNNAVHIFYDKLREILVKHVPIKQKLNYNRQFPRWFSKQIIDMWKAKEKAKKTYNASKNPEDHNEFKRLRSSLKLHIREAYSRFVRDAEESIRNNPNKFWTFINSKKNTTAIPSTMVNNNQNIDDPQGIVNTFADFFSGAFVTSGNFTSNSNANNVNVLNLMRVSESDILSAIKKLKNNMCMGPDLIPAFLLRDCAVIFCKPLLILFNLILTSGIFPDAWKLSRITPVHKKGVMNNFDNYRPIAILCNFCKVFEIILHSFISPHVSNIVMPEQHGFIQGRSTASNLMCVTQFISEVLDGGSQVDVIYTDFSKAFDRLDHGLLLSSLDEAGLCTGLVSLCQSYLTGRSQFVQYRGFKSNAFPQTSGVPQGSILGPLFFIIFINDIANDSNVHYLLYADDLKMYCRITSLSDCVNLQSNIAALDNWCRKNKLPLNASKCKVMSFHRKKSAFLFDYALDGEVLERPDYVKDLGVFFDSELSFSHHIDECLTAAYKSLGFIVRNSRDFGDITTLRLLFITFVRSRLEYASVIWCPIYTIYVTLIERVQRRFFKSAVFLLDGVYPPRGTPQDQFLVRFNLQSLLTRRTMYSVVFLFKLIHYCIKCESITAMIKYRVPRINSRHNSLFLLPLARTNLLIKSPLYQMISNYSNVEKTLDILSCSLINVKNCFV